MEKPITSEQEPLTPERVGALGARMKAILELNGSPVGVRLLSMNRMFRPAPSL